MCACVRACVRACMRACVRVCVLLSVHVCTPQCACPECACTCMHKNSYVCIREFVCLCVYMHVLVCVYMPVHPSILCICTYNTYLGFTGVNEPLDCSEVFNDFFPPVLVMVATPDRPEPKCNTVRTLLRLAGRRLPGAVDNELTLPHNV